jgi:murein DD-endopeptidase MepM/ murein hydrolase activator NlpD
MAMRRIQGSIAHFSQLIYSSLAKVLLLLSFVALMATASASDPSIRFTHSERSLQPGEVVVFKIRSSLPLKRLQVTAFERDFPAFNEDEGLHWTCLVGIDRDAGAGSYEVTMNGVGEDGSAASTACSLDVLPKEFPTRSLTVEPKYVSPPADVLERIRKERELVDSIFTAITQKKLWHGPFKAPVPGEVISAFGKRTVFNGQPRSSHSGTDFRGAVGTPIRAPNAGRVVLTGDLYYTGKTVILDHGLGMYSYLGHMSAITVKEGDSIETGDIVGKVGATGRVTGPHLHWTVRLRISRVDPISLLTVLENF